MICLKFIVVSYRGEEGRALLEECLLITERHKGKGHLDVVTHMMNLATSYSRSKNYVEAERLLRRSLKIMINNVGADDQSITFPMMNLAVILYHLKQDEEAEQFALEALHIREKAFGEDSLPVGKLPPYPPNCEVLPTFDTYDLYIHFSYSSVELHQSEIKCTEHLGGFWFC